MKATFRTLLTLFLVSVSTAWASDSAVVKNLPTPDPRVESLHQAEPSEVQKREFTVEKLESMEPDWVDADADCIAACKHRFFLCAEDCQGRPDQFECVKGCKQVFRECNRSCLNGPPAAYTLPD